MEKEIEEYIVK